MITAATITDYEIRALKYGPEALEDKAIQFVCRVALRSGESTGKHPMCNICGWRKGGTDSWDGSACKCRLRAPAMCRCARCAGIGKVPYDLGADECPSCDGSGLFDSNEVHAARAAVAEILNTRSAK